MTQSKDPIANPMHRRGEATPLMVKSVSQHRRETLESEIEAGVFSKGYEEKTEGTKKIGSNPLEQTPLGYVVGSKSSLTKQAQVGSFTGTGGGDGVGTGYRGSGGTVRQTQEIYSPLWLNSNVNLPRDRATINAWSRSFFALNPVVQNAISLHSTYPISKLNIKCKNPKVNAFFENMIDEIDLMNICVQLAQEYWTLGEAFVYAELDERSSKWSRLLIQNPDYMVVRRSVIAGEPVISLRPDENLKRIVTSNKPADVQQRQQLDPSIVEHVRRGENIPLSNFYVSHIARKISPYEIRGTGLPVSCFRQLMLFDKLRECYSEDTEFLTKDGWRKIEDVVEISTDINPNPNYVNGIQLDENNEITGIYKLKDNVEVACFNPENEEIEYHIPNELHMSHYDGEMIHFDSRNMDILVSPNHKMWNRRKTTKNSKPCWSEWNKKTAKQFITGTTHQFRSVANWSGTDVEYFNVLGTKVPAELYLKFLGYLISEGCISNYKHKNKINYNISFTQCVNSDYYKDIRDTFLEFAKIMNKNTHERIKHHENINHNDCWQGIMYGKDLVVYFANEVGDINGCKSYHKFIPSYVLQLNKDKLKILLDALVSGDGSIINNRKSTAYRYYTASKRLADNVQELAFKCGYVASMYCYNKPSREEHIATEYMVSWSDASDGNMPIFYNNKSKKPKVKSIDYSGSVWCFEVPTGLFITRRNGKITIQGNSKFAQADSMINPITLVKVGGGQDNYKPTPADLEIWREIFENAQYDKHFKIFTHDGVTVEFPSAGSGIYNISEDVNQLLKEIYIGLMVPQVIMDGGADVTYANGGVALDVLRQRYMQFRNMISSWLRRKIFAPISKINDFYDYKDNEKVLIVPDVEWNHMSLFDMGDYIQNLSSLLSQEPRKVSVQTLYRSLGLEYEEEVRKIRRETVDQVIQAKEMEALQRMSLNDLRSIGEEDEIQEIQDNPLPGESAYSDPAGGADAAGGDMGGGGLAGDMGGMGGMGGGLGGDMGGGLGGDLGGISMPTDAGGGGGPPM